MNKVPIKASAISNLTDARYFAARGADWLTFNLDSAMDPSLSIAEFHAIREWVEGPRIVGNFGLQDAVEILGIYEECRLDAIQIHPFMPLHQLEALEGKTIIQSFTIDSLLGVGQELVRFMQERSHLVNFFMLDFSTNEYSWEKLAQQGSLIDILKKLSKAYSIFFSIPFGDNNPHTLINTIQPYGLDVSGSEEEKVGFKSFDELDELLDHIEILE